MALSPRTLFIGFIGTPYESDLFASVLEIADESCRQGHPTTVWTCGYATQLTVSTMALTKPRDLGQWEAKAPSALRFVRDLVERHPGLIAWLVCSFCAEERAALAQAEPARIRPSHEFSTRAAGADQALVVGTK